MYNLEGLEGIFLPKMFRETPADSCRLKYGIMRVLRDIRDVHESCNLLEKNILDRVILRPSDNYRKPILIGSQN